MKTVPCCADSSTWGWDLATRSRFARDSRRTAASRRELGDGVHVGLGKHQRPGRALASRAREILGAARRSGA